MKLVLLVFLAISAVRAIDLFEDLIAFKEDLFNGIVGGITDLGEGVFGKGKCGCPCREYYVPKCEINYDQQCYYDHYGQQVCSSAPVPSVIQIREIECQKCQRYEVPVAKTKWVKECNPVYDEKCKTEYHQHCKEETRCHIIYQTICDNSGYQQHCGSQPRQHCYPETKCHRMPDTKCVPVQKEKCTKVPVETTEYVEEKQCLPFELDLAQMAAHHGDPCAAYQHGDHHVSHDHHGVYQPNFNDQLSYGNAGSSIAISNTADSYGIHDPIIQHQPINSGYHQAKRENHKQTVNPFLRSSPKTKRRTPKSIRLNVKRIEGKKDEDGSQGWVPIPYPLIKS